MTYFEVAIILWAVLAVASFIYCGYVGKPEYIFQCLVFSFFFGLFWPGALAVTSMWGLGMIFWYTGKGLKAFVTVLRS